MIDRSCRESPREPCIWHIKWVRAREQEREPQIGLSTKQIRTKNAARVLVTAYRIMYLEAYALSDADIQLIKYRKKTMICWNKIQHVGPHM